MTKFYFSNALAKKRKKSNVVLVTANNNGQEDSVVDNDEVDVDKKLEETTEDVVAKSKESTETPDQNVEVAEVKTTTKGRKKKTENKTEEISPSNDEKAGDE